MKPGNVILIIVLLTAIINAQNWEELNLPLFGEVSDFTISENNGQIIFTAGNDGVYKTTNGGINWQKISTQNSSLIAVSKISPNYVIINNARSSDGGLTWQTNTTFGGKRIEFAYNSNNTIYRQSGTSIYKSTNFGESWILLISADEFLLHASNPGLVYAVSKKYLFKSVDYGNSWPDTIQYSYYNFSQATATLSSNSINSIYIAKDDTIFRSLNGGLNFQKYFTGIQDVKYIVNDRINSINLFLHNNDIVYESTDNGSTWQYLYSNRESLSKLGSSTDNEIFLGSTFYGGFLKLDKQNKYMKSIGPQKVETAEKILISNDENILIHSNLNLYKTSNNGNDWYLLLSGILPNEQSFKSFGVNHTKMYVVDYSKIIKSTDGGKHWIEIATPLNSIDGIQINENNESNLFLWNDESIVRSTDMGISWSLLNIPEPVGIFGSVSDISKYDNSTVYYVSDESVLTTNKLFRSSNLGNDWNEVIISWENGEQPYRVKFGNTVQNTYLIASSLFKSDNNGNNWQRVYNYYVTPYFALSRLFIDPSNENRMFAPQNSFVIIGSSNAGLNWYSANSGLPASVTQVSDIGISQSGKLFLLTNNGIYTGSPILTALDEDSRLNQSFLLQQNFPNPFNPSTTIKYELPKTGLVTIKVYDVIGNEIATLVNEEKPVGEYEVEFNPTKLSSGIYFYRLQAGDFNSTKKMILLK